jgi:hypothetical protein
MGFVLIRMVWSYQNVVKDISSEKTWIQFQLDDRIINLRTPPSDLAGPALLALTQPKEPVCY